MNLSTNNLKERQRRNAPRAQQHFGLRKLSVGVASVLLSTSLYWGVTTVVAQADTVPGPSATVTTAENLKGG